MKCDIDELYEFNNEFTLMNKGTPQYFINGEIQFPAGDEKPDGTYRTHFGPGVSHNGRMYCDCDHCFRYAARRLLGKRKPEIQGEHERLMRNQTNFVHQNSNFLDYLREKYTPFFTAYTNSEQEMIEHYDDPHEKRALRRQAKQELCEDGRVADSVDKWVRSVLWKLKKNEWAKHKKKPRAICDLGVAASLRGFRVTNYLKTAQDETKIELEGGTFVFCKSPDPFALKEHFDKLYNPPGRFYFLYFSDDSCLSIRNPVTGKVDYYNLDISSCDASHGPAIFEALEKIMPPGWAKHDMKLLIDQCSLPLRIVSRADPRNKIYLKPTFPKLMSGSTITTAINNLANLMIGLSIVRSYEGFHPRNIENPSMVTAAAQAGYILTGCTPLETFQDVQFLKHSPVLDTNGDWQPMLNLGVLLRASGTCNGDLPGSGSLELRARAFQRGLLLGAYPYASCEVIDEMRAAMGEGPVTMTNVFDHKVTEGSDKFPHYRLDSEEIRRRYRLNDSEYADLLDFSRSDVFTFHNSPALSKILEKDYGLSCVEKEDFTYSAFHFESFNMPVACAA